MHAALTVCSFFSSGCFFLISSSLTVQLRLWPTSIRKGSSTEIWNQKTLCCSRERREWVKDPVNHLVMTNTPKPQQRGHITGCLSVGYLELLQKTRLPLIHIFILFSWAQLCCTEYLMWKTQFFCLPLQFRGTCSYLTLWASPYFVYYVTYQTILQPAVGHRIIRNMRPDILRRLYIHVYETLLCL